MTPNTNSVESVKQFQANLADLIAKVRLSRNLTQSQLAEEAGTSLRTIKRLENGEGGTLDSFIRILMALRLERSLLAALPDTSVRPVERVKLQGHERRRASGVPAKPVATEWAWGEDDE